MTQTFTIETIPIDTNVPQSALAMDKDEQNQKMPAGKTSLRELPIAGRKLEFEMDLEAQAETEQQKLALVTANALKHDRFLRENVDHKELKLLRSKALTNEEEEEVRRRIQRELGGVGELGGSESANLLI